MDLNIATYKTITQQLTADTEIFHNLAPAAIVLARIDWLLNMVHRFHDIPAIMAWPALKRLGAIVELHRPLLPAWYWKHTIVWRTDNDRCEN